MKQYFFLALIVISCLLPADGAWIHSLEDAQTKAQAENKDILLYFTGSDWCSWCVVLHREVLDTEVWQKEASKKFVWVKLDFPRFTPIAPEQKEYNQKIADKFAIQGFPSIFLLDAQGKPYATTGYQDGGAEKYLKHVEELEKQKSARDELLTKYQSAETKEEKQAALAELIVKLEEWQVGNAYVSLKEDLFTLEEDSEKKFTYASELAALFQGSDQAKSEQYLKAALEIKPEQKANLELRIVHLPKIETDLLNQGKWTEAVATCKPLMTDAISGEPAKMLYYFATVAEANMQNWDTAIAYVEKALTYKGGPPKADMQLNQALGYLRFQKQQADAAANPTEESQPSEEETTKTATETEAGEPTTVEVEKETQPTETTESAVEEVEEKEKDKEE